MTTTTAIYEPQVTTNTLRRIYVCKFCKSAQTVDHKIQSTQNFYANGIPSYRDISAIEEGEKLPMSRLDAKYSHCPKCKANGITSYRKVVQVKGHKSEHQCDAKCMNATGPDCDCSCGGANHGGAHK